MRSPVFLLPIALPLLASLASAQNSPLNAPFSASPQALRRAFEDVESASAPVTVLLEEASYEYDSEGRQTFHFRRIFKALTKAGAEDWATLSHTWSPWQEDRPILRARVIAADGSVHELDPKTIADAPARDSDDDVLSDRRIVRAPLPAMETGAIVEEEILTHQLLVAVAGNVENFYFGASVPVARTIIHIQAPTRLPLRFATRLLPNVSVSDRIEGGVRELSFEQGPMKALDPVLPLLAPDEPRSPHVVFSIAPDWHTVAANYADAVAKQLSGFDSARYLPKFPAGASRDAKILAIVNYLNKEIRYTGIEFSESSLIPHKPQEVVQNKYGDCKDKSTLAIALLRAAGIEAHLALLDSSLGEDIDPGFPGMGVFNHAIVYVPGKPDLWLDPTDDGLRLGVISPDNQGRYALIIRQQTTALIRIPELSADQNRIVETREFELPELGRARVIETSQTFGAADRNYRGLFRDKDQKALREDLKDYIEWTYGEAKTRAISTGDGADLTSPFQLKIELDDAQRGTTVRTESLVAIRLSQLTSRLPEFFRTDPDDKKNKPDESKPSPGPRTADFSIAQPETYEWHYSIHAAPGFRIRQLPDAIDQKLGPATLTAKFHSDNPTTIKAEFQFVIPKRRFTAAEGLALRDAVVELEKRKMLLVYFDQIGETDLASGDVRGAIAEFTALQKLHPTEALHAMQMARALLAAGAGETARHAAREAVSLEPASAQAYVQLAEVLKSDLIGRTMEKGFDFDAAVAAYRKALELRPDDSETRANLAILLEYNSSAVHYGSGAKLDDAVAEYSKILDKLVGLGIPANYPIALLRAGHAKEVMVYLEKSPDSETTQALRVCADAILSGKDAALRQAGQVSGVDAKRRVLTSAAQTLLAVRRFDLAADLLTEASAGAANGASTANLVAILRTVKKHEEMSQTISQPEDAIRVMLLRAFSLDQHRGDWTEPFSDYLKNDVGPDDAKAIGRSLSGARGQANRTGLTEEAMLDVGLSIMQFSKEGSDNDGWVVRTTIPGGLTTGGTQQMAWFVLREAESYRIVAVSGEFSGVGRLVIDLLDHGKTAQAGIWLDRVRRELPAGGGDDPLSGPMFSRLWQLGATTDLGGMRVAAAALLTGKEDDAARVIPVLEEAAKSAAGSVADAISASLSEAYFTAKRYDRSLGLSEDLLRRFPRSPVALRMTFSAAYASGGTKEAGRIAGAYLKEFNDDINGQRVASAIALSYGDVDRAAAIEKQIIDAGRAQGEDFNNIAWGALMMGRVSPGTLALANRGMSLGNNTATGLMHTIAALDAELGKPSEARALLLQRITALGEEEPGDDDWYVFGRIAESYGLVDEAKAMYRRLQRPKRELVLPVTSYALAQKRLESINGNR